ncbi:MAG: ATP-binding protein [Candidatus Micropelagos sp.]|nr:ATP-binding protein [Candidatus Micropelagos sp.]
MDVILLPERVRISVSSKRLTHGCEVNIRDNGPGISEEKVDKLFSSELRSSKAGGSGLGLAIAHDLVNLHGGTIELLYSGNTGSCFKIYIPDQESPINSGDENADDFATKDKQIVA